MASVIAASSWALYLLGRDLMHFVRPWWLRIVVIFVLVALVFAWALVAELLDRRHKKLRRERQQAELSRFRAEMDLALDHRLPLATRRAIRRRILERERPAPEGNCASWIPRGFE